MFVLFVAYLVFQSVDSMSNPTTVESDAKMVWSSAVPKSFTEEGRNETKLMNITAPLLRHGSRSNLITRNQDSIDRLLIAMTPSGKPFAQAKAYNYSTTSTRRSATPSSGRSPWQIAGIVIGILVFLCCCGAITKSSGRWVTARVWVQD